MFDIFWSLSDLDAICCSREKNGGTEGCISPVMTVRQRDAIADKDIRHDAAPSQSYASLRHLDKNPSHKLIMNNIYSIINKNKGIHSHNFENF